jgi:hypothetical protein
MDEMDLEMDAGDPSDGTADGGSWRDNGGRLIAYRSASWRRIKAVASARPSDRYIPWPAGTADLLIRSADSCCPWRHLLTFLNATFRPRTGRSPKFRQLAVT